VADRARALDDFLAQMEGRDDITGVLIDMKAAQSQPESFEAASSFAQRIATDRVLRRCRHAYLYADTASANPVVEMLAQARQFKFRRFAQMSEALDWLLMPRRTGLQPAVQLAQEPPLAHVLASLRREAGFLPAAKAA
jgi:hypothetical protein